MNKPAKPSKSKVNLILAGFTLSAIVAAVTGVFSWVPFGIAEQAADGRLLHVPFWLSIGLATAFGNYIPIAKGKPVLFPIIGIAVATLTFGWFMVDNFIDIHGLADFWGRAKLGICLLIACYATTHISLLMLAHREYESNGLLYATIVVILASTLMYFLLFYGGAKLELGIYLISGVAGLFFTKIALTIAVISQKLATPIRPQV